MAFSYKIDPEKRIVYIHFSGELREEQVYQLAEQLRKDPEMNPSFDTISDLTGVERFELRGTEVMHLTAKINLFTTTAKRAIVVQGQMAYGLARIYQSLKETAPVAIFGTMEDAEQWITGKRSRRAA